MPAIEWNDSYSVGESKMDAQHRQLFAAINELYDSMASAMPDRQHSLQCFKFLKEYTLTHFAEEEALMRKVHFPGYENHVRLHNDLLSRFNAISLDIGKDQIKNEDIHAFMTEWLLQHIGSEDTKIAAHIRHPAD